MNNIKKINRDDLTYRQSTSAVILDKLGRTVIIQKNSYKNNEWDIPGGGIEEGEKAEVAIIRELGEELGSDKFEVVKTSKLTDRYEWQDDVITKRILEKKQFFRGQERTQFLVKFTGEESEIKTQKEEIRAFKWVLPDELPAYFVFPHQMEKMKVLLKEFGVETNY